MQRQIEESPVNRHQQTLAAQSTKAAHGAFRSHVNIRPQRVKRANLKHN